MKRVGLIGAGWVTEYHLPAWRRQRARAQIVAIADPSPVAREDKCVRFAIARSYTSAEEMLEAERLDVADICTPRQHHADLVKLSATRGLDVICQKPLAQSFPQAADLVAGLDGKTRLMVHENWRFRAYYRRLKSWLNEGLAGEVRQVQLDFLSCGMIVDQMGQRPALVRQPFFRRQERLLVMEVLIHHLDTLRFLLGEMDVVAARLERSNDDIIAEDVASAVLRRRADDVLVTITANLAARGAPPAPRDQLRIFGTRSTLTLDGNVLTAEGEESRREEFDAEATYQGAYDVAIAHFLNCLEQDQPFETSPEDNLRTLKLVEDIYLASGFDPTQEPR